MDHLDSFLSEYLTQLLVVEVANLETVIVSFLVGGLLWLNSRGAALYVISYLNPVFHA